MQALWMLAATFMFALMGMSVKLAAEMQTSLPHIIIMRGLPSVIMLLLWARASRQSLKPVAWRLHIWRNLAGATAMWSGFYALSHLPLATAVTLNYTAPLFIAGWMLGWGGARRDYARISAVVLGFAGVIAVLRPTLNESEWFAAMLGLIAGALGAVAQLQVRALGRLGEAAWRTVLYFSLVVCITGVIALAFQGWSLPTLHGWAALGALGATGLLGQLAMTRAFGLGSALLSAALQYTIIIFASLLGYLVWNDIPDMIAISGMVLIVAASLLSIWSTARMQTGR